MEYSFVKGGAFDPNTFTVQTYLALVKQMHIASTTNFDAETFKQVDGLL